MTQCIDRRVSLKSENGSEKKEHEFFVVPEINRNIILGRDWLKQFGVFMYYDLGCIRIGKSYVKMEEDIHISSLDRHTAHTVIKPQIGMAITSAIQSEKCSSGFSICH